VPWYHCPRGKSTNQVILQSKRLSPFFLFCRKRSFPVDSFSPPNSSVTLWAPLIAQVRSNHPSFSFVLVQRIIFSLLSESSAPDTHFDELNRPDISFDLCLARWAFWIIDSWDIDAELDFDFKRDVTVTLVNALGPGSVQFVRDKMACVPLFPSF
jgi:ribosomal biogenesis protein LAS1